MEVVSAGHGHCREREEGAWCGTSAWFSSGGHVLGWVGDVQGGDAEGWITKEKERWR